MDDNHGVRLLAPHCIDMLDGKVSVNVAISLPKDQTSFFQTACRRSASAVTGIGVPYDLFIFRDPQPVTRIPAQMFVWKE